MLFGEIVEPFTRALIDDETDEYPEYIEPEIDWEGIKKPPNEINNLIVIETDKLIKIFKNLVLNETELVTTIKNGNLQVFKLQENNFVVVYNKEELTTGQIIEAMEQWLKKSKNLYGITTIPMATYQNSKLSSKPEFLLRVLQTEKTPSFTYKKLESPNLVTGFGADCLSYCIHTGLKFCLFIIYLNATPLDSINTTPIIELIDLLKIPRKTFTNVNSFASNLYM